ncbi:MAG: hypothetical protein ACRDOK_14575 [Streptosporangiaceae bacterium]
MSAATVSAASLPLAGYEADTSQQDAINNAENELIAQCMRAKGFTMPPPTAEQQDLQALAAKSAQSGADQPYGITSAAYAAQYGYGLAFAPGSAPSHVTTVAPGTTISFGPKESAAFNIALVGYASGLPPPGQNTFKGCQGQTLQRLQAGLDTPDPKGLVGQLMAESDQQAQSAPQVIQVLTRWSSCMAADGYQLATPMQAMHLQWPVVASPTEIAVAKADVACKNRTKLVSVWLTAEAAVQRALIQSNAVALDQIRQAYAAEIRRAEALLGGR